MKAILLAAGMGTRLRPITIDTPKALVKVNGIPMLERQIEYLKEIGINEIIVATGYLSDKFEYLKKKYGVKLIHNDKFDVYNNIYTMYLIKSYLNDAYVIEGDVYINKNFLKKDIHRSTYFSAYRNFKDEWKIIYDEDKRVTDIEIGSGQGYILSGVSYWNEEDGLYIQNKLEEIITTNGFENLYWDDVVKDNIKNLNVFIEKISSDYCYEIDSISDLENVNNKFI
ncbi:sugar phosphate nucleotidyltransferase [Hathewaya histolytica]|uniref:sugar phosphate nucleotidyltransferase n=1 Tax=Hathewaya histolytica TaxID=1498 RepID=UPI003B6784E0